MDQSLVKLQIKWKYLQQNNKMRESYLLFFVININLGLGEDVHRPGPPGRTTGTVTPKRSPKKSPMLDAMF